MKCVDVNGDGWPDIIAANQNADTVSVLLQDSSKPGTFLPATNYSTGSTTNSGPRVALTVEATETCWLRGMGYLVD